MIEEQLSVRSLILPAERARTAASGTQRMRRFNPPARLSEEPQRVQAFWRRMGFPAVARTEKEIPKCVCS